MTDRHLHVGANDQIGETIAKALRSASKGSIGIQLGGEPAATITIEDRKVTVDLLRPAEFQLSKDETGLFDKLKTASEFGRKLSDNGTTLSFRRKGKEAVRIGSEAKPTFSKLLTKSDDMQMTSVREFTRLKKDLKSD
jgi:hypothetical protein